MGALCCHKKLTRPDVLKSKMRPKVKLLLIGLDNAGKTSTVMHLLGRPLDSVVPTIGFSNLEMAQFKQFAVEIYDLGGGAKIRDIWNNYFALVHGVIYVVDSTDANRLTEVASLLASIMKNELICQKPLLILINKQDVESAMDEADISKQLNLSFLANQYQCPTRMESTSATAKYTRKGDKDAGIEAGYAWLLSTIIKNWPKLSVRVEGETCQQLEIEKKVMNERYRRFRKDPDVNSSNGAKDGSGEIDDGENSLPNSGADLTPFRPICELIKETAPDSLTDVQVFNEDEILELKPQANGGHTLQESSSFHKYNQELSEDGKVKQQTNEFLEVEDQKEEGKEVRVREFTPSASHQQSKSADVKLFKPKSDSNGHSRRKSLFTSSNRIVPVE